MAKYGNHAQAGFAMIVVAASLATIGLLALALADDVLFADNIQRDNTAHFNECKENDFKADGCEKYWDRINTDVSGIFVDLDE
jgi:Tfp pilus assembly protein PilX